MSKTLTIYYDVKRDGDIGKAIDELMNIEHSPYFRRRSRSEVARLVLAPALARKTEFPFHFQRLLLLGFFEL
ncbi:unnamed protein product [marine sediment metagenome]|uniref:Uncharacterized protein n=1 Tax=marine sediment metagenome TaxID=412755 RepID=X1D5N5_9ZZZZ